MLSIILYIVAVVLAVIAALVTPVAASVDPPDWRGRVNLGWLAFAFFVGAVLADKGVF